MTLDNSYSLLKAKVVAYSFELLEQELSSAAGVYNMYTALTKPLAY